MLRCPVCEKTDMVVLELEGIEIDYCLKCGGIWLDSGELELLIGSAQKKDEIMTSFRDAEKDCKERKKPCPVCEKAMKKMSVEIDGSSVLLDECPQKHGIWFDKGELYQIINCASKDKKDKDPVLTFLSDIFCGNNRKKEDDK